MKLIVDFGKANSLYRITEVNVLYLMFKETPRRNGYFIIFINDRQPHPTLMMHD